jgi:hypothetical protein
MKKLLLVLLLLLVPVYSWGNTVTFTSSASGSLYGSSTTYSTVRDAATASAFTSTAYFLGQMLATTTYTIYRNAFVFNTSWLPDDCTITSAVLTVNSISDISTTDFDVVIMHDASDTHPTDTPTTADYDRTIYSSNGGSKNTSTWTAVGDNDIDLNATGLGWINKTGNTRLVLMSSRDIDGTAPTGNEYVYLYFQSTTFPRLTVTFTSSTSIFHATSASGRIAAVEANANTAWSKATGDVVALSEVRAATFYSSGYYYIYRGVVYFDTSALPDDCVVSGATLSLHGQTYDFDEASSIVVQVGDATYPHIPLVVADYDKSKYSGSGGTLLSSNYVNLSYNNITLTSDSWAAISNTGTTKLVIRLQSDIDGAPNTTIKIWVFDSDYGGGLKTPVLSVSCVQPRRTLIITE